MSQLSGRQGLRDIESNLQNQRQKLYHLGAKPVARSTLARLNEQQSAELYEALFYQRLKRCHLRGNTHKFRFKNPLYSLDASTIGLSLKIFPWAKIHQSKAGVKLHTGLNNASLIPEFVDLGSGKEADLIKGCHLNFHRGSIVAFDKGYIDYRWYSERTKQGVSFVSRLHPKAVYQVTKAQPVRPDSEVAYDHAIQLTRQHAQKQAPRLRLIGYTCPDTHKQFRFITNNFKLAATTVAAIYKDRWQVELFFNSDQTKPEDISIFRYK